MTNEEHGSCNLKEEIAATPDDLKHIFAATGVIAPINYLTKAYGKRRQWECSSCLRGAGVVVRWSRRGAVESLEVWSAGVVAAIDAER